MSEAYREAGVDIDAGEEVVSRIRQHVDRTRRPEVLGQLGGFGALFQMPRGYEDPVLVSGTDGVGTKLLIAQHMQSHRGIGIDLVAMCVNDIATLGAEPLFFLDYFATGKLKPAVAEDVVAGIAEGCVQSGCALIGGETAEMPGMYGPGHYDLAGFCVGVVERSKILDGRDVKSGMSLIGFPSTGLHSNGYSLARHICKGLDLREEHGFSKPLGEVLLEPTRIYVHLCQRLLKSGQIHALAHITGGGLTDNIVRVIPEGLGIEINSNSWPRPEVFDFLQSRGQVSDDDMYRTFNCGVGLVAVVDSDQAVEIAESEQGFVIGSVVDVPGVSWK